MTICECGKKYISKAQYDNHKAKTHPEVKTEVEPKIESKPVTYVSQDITLKFSKPVEVRINGKLYMGKDITVEDIQLASEIVRIAREAYGDEVFGY